MNRQMRESKMMTAEDSAERNVRPRVHVGRTAVEQARLVLLMMINIAQLWTLSATVEASLAARWHLLAPLIVASGICAMITLSILLWWRPDRSARDQ